MVAAAFIAVSQFVRRETSLPSGFASTTQAIGVTALLISVLAMVWGFASLARALSREGDRFGAVVVSSIVAGIVLLPLLGLGMVLLLPGFVALIARGRLGSARVRLPAAALPAGLVAAAAASMWPSGTEGTIVLYVVSFLGGTSEGAALLWFARRTDSPAAQRQARGSAFSG